jgi:hypothetical protein
VAGELSALLLIMAQGSEIEGCNMKSTFDWIVFTNVMMEGGDLSPGKLQANTFRRNADE